MKEEQREKEGIKDILFEELVICGNTHENAPPRKDCYEECGVDILDQVRAANPIIKPMRSGGKKHRKCMDCWNEYIDGLILRLVTNLKGD